jgi:hypothetical protein
MPPTIIPLAASQQPAISLRHRPRKYVEKQGKVNRLSEDLGPNHRSKRDIADALAGMSSGESDPSNDTLEKPRDCTPGALDDDATIAPAPQRSSISPRQPMFKTARDSGTEFRRTLIPILLTLGVLLPVIGSLRWITGPDLPFVTIARWVAIAMLIAGPILLLAAILNMVQVKRALRHGV